VADRVVVPAGTTSADAVAAAGLPTSGPKAIVVVRDEDGRLRDLDWAPEVDTEVEPVAIDSPDGLNVLRHSTAHVLAQAVQDLFPEAKLGIGPPIENGFYYDFAVPSRSTRTTCPSSRSGCRRSSRPASGSAGAGSPPSTRPRPNWPTSRSSWNSSTSRATSTRPR
jgi:hypothetical protein